MCNDNKIQSTALRLTQPGQFERVCIEHAVQENDVIVEPYLASVCHADLRYFTGSRRQEALETKLPMALFHEGLGVVKASHHPKFKTGDRVVIVPSIPGYVLNNTSKDDCCRHCQEGGQPNYCLNGAFLGSGYDGIGQSRLVIGGDNLVLVPNDLADDIALLAELCSVSVCAVNLKKDLQETIQAGKKVAVFGDGPVGYLTAATLHFIFNVPKSQLIVFGAVEEKLAEFTEFSTTHLVHDYDFIGETGVQTVLECTGGKFSSSAINQAIDLIDREGEIILMGVTEDLVPINTRDVLEKGLTLKGSSRSTKKDFEQLMEAFKNKQFQKILQQLVPNEAWTIHSIDDLIKAMHAASDNRGWKKTYMSFAW